MDDIKSKFLELLSKEEFREKIPIVNSPVQYEYTSLNNHPTTSEAIQNTTVNNDDIPSDTDILDNIEKEYFIENGFDPSRYELMKISHTLKMEQIENNLHHLQSQLAVVSKKVLNMILENQTTCQQEFNKIQDICDSLKMSVMVCQNARDNLHTAQKLFTTASLGILSNYRKRKIILELLKSLNTIKTLLKTETRLEELLAEGDFPGAISIILECQQAALTYRHFKCVVVLAGKLQDTLVMTEEQLDVALASICQTFSAEIYSKLQSAYAQLGKRRIAMDQLHMHYTSAIHNSAFNVVYHFLRRRQETSPNSKKPYAQLCKQVEDSKLIECLLKLCQTLWSILRSYNGVVNWHSTNSDKPFVTDGDDVEQNINEQYIKQKLETGLGKLWHDVQSRVSLLINGCDVSYFKFDDFLRILAILHKLIQVGEEFCGSDSAELQSSMKEQSSNYFRNYHLSRLGELRLFLENEAWTPCPVKDDFNLLHLQEFRDLRYVVQNASLKKNIRKHSDSADKLSCGSSGYFSRYLDISTPFDCFSDLESPLSWEEDILLIEDANSVYGSEESEDESERKRKTNNCSRKTYQKPPSILLTNTTLTVLRQCGRYLQMSHLLRSITSDVIVCLRQLFEYYLYAVCIFYFGDLPEVTSSSVQYSIHKLKSVLKRIEDNLIQTSESETDNVTNKVLAPCISPTVDLTDSEKLYGLSERLVGVESLVLLSEQFNLLRDYLEHSINNDDTDKHALNLFYSQVISVAGEVRKPVYECVARKVIDSKNILNLMSKVNWEVKDVMCQHSQYVDVLLRELQIFAMRLEHVSSSVTISSVVSNHLWQSIAEFLSEIFVEGFSNAKKCSNGGRALMQLDYTQLMLTLEKLSGLKPIPRREFVESYVKAYYLPESALQNWITEHTEYSSKQQIALVSCTCSNNKKTRQKLINIIEEMDRK